MTNNDFHFDFNEDADPVEELHRLRVARTDHFKTLDALWEYDRTHPLPGMEEMIAELKVKAAEKKRQKRATRNKGNAASPAPARSKSKTVKKTAARRKSSKQPAYA